MSQSRSRRNQLQEVADVPPKAVGGIAALVARDRAVGRLAGDARWDATLALLHS
jgi:hypothetical protein